MAALVLAVSYKLFIPAMEKAERHEHDARRAEMQSIVRGLQEQIRTMKPHFEKSVSLEVLLATSTGHRPVSALLNDYHFDIEHTLEALARGEKKVFIVTDRPDRFQERNKGWVGFVEPPVVEEWTSYEMLLFKQDRKRTNLSLSVGK